MNSPEPNKEFSRDRKKSPTPAWVKRSIIFGIVAGLILVAIAVTGRWNLYIPVLILMGPVVFIFEGLRIIELQLAFPLFLFWTGPITGERAIRRGRIMLGIGVLLVVPCILISSWFAFRS